MSTMAIKRRNQPGSLEHAIKVLKSAPPREVQRLGYHFQANDYYSPLNDLDWLEENPDIWREPHRTPNIDWNDEGQRAMVEEVARYVEELKDVPVEPPANPIGFGWHNDFWNNADALVQYGLLRSRKPKRVVEIGSGWSSMLMQRALAMNQEHCEVSLVDPYPNEAIMAVLPDNWRVHRSMLQRAPSKLFESLESGDFCFYDGSHCSNTGSDVNWFFFDVLPKLASGVLIHLHDIFLPEPYPDDWIFDRGQSWNEQFLLQAFLMHNNDYEILLGNRYISKHHPDLLKEKYKGIQPIWGVSFWMRKR